MKIPTCTGALLRRNAPERLLVRIRALIRRLTRPQHPGGLRQTPNPRHGEFRQGLARLVRRGKPWVAMLAALPVAVMLAAIGPCNPRAGRPSPRITIADLDARAAPYIAEAKSAIPPVVDDLCQERGRLYWLMAKDKCLGGDRARRHIAQKTGRRITGPLGKAAAVYQCAVNPEASAAMAEEAALDTMGGQLQATAGLAIDGLIIAAALRAFLDAADACSPAAAAIPGVPCTCAALDGPLPIGDVVGAALAFGGAAWCCRDLYKAHKAMPAVLASALEAAVDATVAQCRAEAACAL